ncbi:dethiobiotin synthase [Candidatus Pandoraea novymonadis]|uniref:ATP-dependent dethiobiotin synthetase BioD n=1 Tax=Candidatus Pandoraea novymonadis TaxID=1808959 RepID=A0ABX5FEI0_9BURK|nr:dethiobiotin synthase [Candidatus Pandoraea novymonadis]PSB92118.1 ATP-dependent dethiobiotin synthetase BioD 1 [Candidatus Pandoraea novymonadis]
MSSKYKGYFVVGTDTGVGKTLVSTGLLHHFANKGYRAVGMKPVASGAVFNSGAWQNDDVTALREASNVDVPIALNNPYLLREPTAPHIAAATEGIQIKVNHIQHCYRALQKYADSVIVEGIGGFLVPLNENVHMGHLVTILELPVILVVGIRLGCINHTLLTTEAISARGISMVGWIANIVDAEMRQIDATINCLKKRIQSPMLGYIPWLSSSKATNVAQFIRLP